MGDVAERELDAPFEAVRQRVEQAIADAGMVLFARIDHAAGARAAGYDMPDTQLLIFGNARAGTPAMLVAPVAALDLPLRMLIRATARGTALAYRRVGAALAAAGVPAETIGRLEQAQERVFNAAG